MKFKSPLPSQPLAAATPVLRWERLSLLGIMLLAAGLNLSGIEHNGLGNTYYAVTVHSMTLNWHNWFFAAFDPGGFVTVDKPPLGFWIQSISVWIFGFNGPALILPQALAGVISVWLLYHIVRRHFSPVAALFSAALLAIAPINVVVNRSNVLESLLVLTLLGATLATSLALEHGTLSWLLLAGVLVGLGFTIKMLEAYLVIPALGGAYLLTAPIPWRDRTRHLAAAGAALLLVSLTWITIVTITPPANRPYVGSSYHNSEFDLVWLYNGVQRFIGTPWTQPFLPGDPRGQPGPLRLVMPPLAGQSGWLLLLALAMLSLVALHAWRSQESHLSRQQGALVLWGLWLAPMIIFFSPSHFFNESYLALLSPAIAALVGIGVTTCWSVRQEERWTSWVLGAGVFATVAVQSAILLATPFWNPWLLPVLGIAVGFGVAAWGCVLALQHLPARASALLQGVVTGSLLVVLCFAPFLWTVSSLHPDSDPGFPRAGPVRGPIAAADVPQAPPRLVTYLGQHNGATKFLVATVDAATAIPIILTTNAPVMALGGYSGFDPILTPATLRQSIANHTIRYFYLPATNLTLDEVTHLYPQVGSPTPQFTNALTQWVALDCRAVPPAEWSDVDAATTTTLAPLQLFDCAQ